MTIAVEDTGMLLLATMVLTWFLAFQAYAVGWCLGMVFGHRRA